MNAGRRGGDPGRYSLAPAILFRSWLSLPCCPGSCRFRVLGRPLFYSLFCLVLLLLPLPPWGRGSSSVHTLRIQEARFVFPCPNLCSCLSIPILTLILSAMALSISISSCYCYCNHFLSRLHTLLWHTSSCSYLLSNRIKAVASEIPSLLFLSDPNRITIFHLASSPGPSSPARYAFILLPLSLRLFTFIRRLSSLPPVPGPILRASVGLVLSFPPDSPSVHPFSSLRNNHLIEDIEDSYPSI
ncbi:hypothetical protein B0I35DRAFT_271424 [Stachybotrys elegans]|uniref:Uncharacterized protein n=1 Tax=Stachybotrys elegans TaxID=80388 RepID=A0A8K0WP29_9HYPO|nr:hypothetical protein B0I35DRAFT_271424 [Stachybotrys elegans]